MEKKKEHPKPAVTVDIVIFTLKEDELKVLLVKRGLEPFRGKWALPGGFIKINESLEDAAARELLEETGVKADYLEQLYTFGDLGRDPRDRVITVTYFALLKSEKVNLTASTDVSDVKWFSAYDIPELAFDHKKILEYATKRLRWKFEYTTIAFSVLAEKFTLSSLQKIYEIIFNKNFDKRNFRKKIISLGVVKQTKEKIKEVSYRPPKLYTFIGKIGDIITIFKDEVK